MITNIFQGVKMIYRLSILLSLAILLFIGSNAHALRCHYDLISEDDTKFEVTLTLHKCGTVLDEEIIRSEDSDQKIEKWLIRVREWAGQYCYELTFIDAVLRDIESLGKCD